MTAFLSSTVFLTECGAQSDAESMGAGSKPSNASEFHEEKKEPVELDFYLCNEIQLAGSKQFIKSLKKSPNLQGL